MPFISHQLIVFSNLIKFSSVWTVRLNYNQILLIVYPISVLFFILIHRSPILFTPKYIQLKTQAPQPLLKPGTNIWRYSCQGEGFYSCKLRVPKKSWLPCYICHLFLLLFYFPFFTLLRTVLGGAVVTSHGTMWWQAQDSMRKMAEKEEQKETVFEDIIGSFTSPRLLAPDIFFSAQDK